jgi:hypothetical protein
MNTVKSFHMRANWGATICMRDSFPIALPGSESLPDGLRFDQIVASLAPKPQSCRFLGKAFGWLAFAAANE